MLLLAIIGGYLIASFMEYTLHRYYLHKESGHPHITEHHVIFHGKTSYENTKAHRKDIVSNIGYIMASWLPNLICAGLMYTYSPHYAVIQCLAGGVYLIWVEVGHYLYHKPHGFFIEKWTIFNKIKAHHKIHHTYYQTNFGIGSSVWDHLLKTKK